MVFAVLDVYPDYVQIDKHTLERPSSASVGQWVEFWENAKVGETWQEGFEAGKEEAEQEISTLEEEVERLERELKETEGDLADAENEIALREEQFDKEYERGRADGIIEGRLDSSL